MKCHQILPMTLGLLLLLTGCCREQVAFETVDDQWVEPAVAAAPYAMMVAVPTDAALEAYSCTETYRTYVQADGDYELTCQILPAGDRTALIRTLSGREPEQLQILRTTRFDMPEEQFSWAADDESGTLVCRAAILEDDDWYYVLTCSARAEQAKANAAAIEQAFASLGLYTDEGF